MAMDMTTALTIKANVVGQSDIGSLEKSLGKVSKQTDKASTAMGRLKSAAGGALGAMRGLLPALGVTALAAFTKKSLDAADAMSKMSQRTGIAVPALDKFRQAANLSDTSIESLERAFPALTKNMDMAAQKGKGPAFDAFQRLGVAVKDSSGKLRDADAVMLDIADRFNNMKDGSEKAALASAVFGTRIGSELIPMLNMGGDAVRDMNTAMTQEMADKAALVNDKITGLGETFNQMGVSLTTALLPAIDFVVGALQGAMNIFNSLPGPLQSIIAAVAALAAGLAVLMPVIVGVSSVMKAFAALKIGATIAGWLPALASIGSTISGLLPVITGVLSGPVGWIALLVGAGAAVYAFRDQIAEVFATIGEFFAPAVEAFNTVFVAPLVEAGQSVINFFVENWSQILEAATQPFQAAWDFISGTFLEPIGEAISTVKDTILTTWSELQQGLISPFQAAAEIIKGVLNAVLSSIGNVINGAIDSINNLINGVNRISSAVGIPAIPTIPNVEVPQFAKGGMVNGAQLAVVGEAGPEYIVPAGKAQGFAQNILAGVRGPGAIPAYAEGGYVGPVNITTGPVMQQGGTNYVTMAQFEAGVRDVAAAMTRSSRSYGSRRFTGIS